MLHGIQPGATVHFIDHGIDTGPILFFQDLPIQATDTILDVRGKMVVLSVETLLRGVGMVASNQHQLTPQDPEGGHQFFAMTPALLEKVQRRIAAQALYSYDPEEFRFPPDLGELLDNTPAATDLGVIRPLIRRS